jgi:predicted metal-binding membrane protein
MQVDRARAADEDRATVPSWSEPRARALPRELMIAGGVLGTAVAAWAAGYRRMRGMDMGPGTDLGTLPWFVGIWVVMMTAMMLPSLVPATLRFGGLAERRAASGRRPVSTLFFVGGYLLAWTAYGLLAYATYRAAAELAPHALAWRRGGRFVAAAALLASGVYELTPLKGACLRRCRGSVALVGRWRDGVTGAVSMGARHGVDCIGCCWGLMLALFALGVMSLAWMAAIAIAIAAEKVLPRSERLVWAVAVLTIAAAAWVAAAPGSLPAFHVPG